MSTKPGATTQPLASSTRFALPESLPSSAIFPSRMPRSPRVNAAGKTGVLLLNLGTPRSPKTGDVRRYLREFLSDPRVIDLAAPARWALVNLVIAPFRAPRSAAQYRKIWSAAGSPLLANGLAL